MRKLVAFVPVAMLSIVFACSDDSTSSPSSPSSSSGATSSSGASSSGTASSSGASTSSGGSSSGSTTSSSGSSNQDSGSDANDSGDASDAGLTCDSFCDADLVTCSGANSQYTNKADCLTKCAGWQVGSPSDTSGNTLYCREYHRSVASQSTGNATTHCPHTSDSGGGVCS